MGAKPGTATEPRSGGRADIIVDRRRYSGATLSDTDAVSKSSLVSKELFEPLERRNLLRFEACVNSDTIEPVAPDSLAMTCGDQTHQR
jgi:hypothetical protein